MSNANQFRHNGRFARKNIITWKKNISESMKQIHLKYKNSGVKLPNGHRIVDFNKLAEDMWCKTCNLPLSFRFFVKEDIIGLASVYHLKCQNCEKIHVVNSSAYERESSRSKYHVNFKLALAILDGGIGESQLNTILSALNVPTVNHNLIKRYATLVGPAIETVAKESCHEALKIERELTILNEGYLDFNDEAGVEETHEADDSEEHLNIDANTSVRICSPTDNVIEKENVVTDLIVDSNNNVDIRNELVIESDSGVNKNTVHSDNSNAETRETVEKKFNRNLKRKLENAEGNNNSKTKKRKVGLRLSYDGAWLKKGSGRCYNRRQGHGTAFGHYSRKCVAYATRNKSCRYCSIKSKKNHDCRSNFVGSSKEMEADIAVEILTNNDTFKAKNVEIKTPIGDEDSCTIANVRRASNQEIDKWTDINHATRKISKFLYGIKRIPKTAIEYLLYCFKIALRANKDNVESTKAAMLNIVPHAFGEHCSCDSWCNYASNPETFKHKYLPGDKPFVGDDLRASILPIFKQAADNAEKLAPLGSSQINENCNAVITTKAPKAKHYSESSSSDFRVAAGISQVNLGTNYIDRVNSTLRLSPSKQKSSLFRIKKDEQRKKFKALITTKEFKQRRRALFSNRQKLNASAEAREGVTYQSNSEMDASLELNEKFIAHIAPTIDDTTKLVIFDIETTGLKLTDEIVQIAAQCNEDTYNAYIMPSCNFSAEASNTTGLRMKNGQLFKDSVLLKTISAKCAISGFIRFLNSVSSSVVLAAHNGLRFDVPRILTLVKQVNLLKEFQSIVVGFTDTLTFSKKQLNERRTEKKSFAQSALAEDYLGSAFTKESAHDASVDVSTLQQLLNHRDINISAKKLMNAGVTVDNILNAKNEKDKLKNLKNSLSVLKVALKNHPSKQQCGVSVNIITKIAKAGISMTHLENTYKNNGFDGLKILLSQSINKRPRVTAREETIIAIQKRLDELSNNVQ